VEILKALAFERFLIEISFQKKGELFLEKYVDC